MAAHTQDLEARAHALGIRYFLVSFMDLYGVLRAKLVPTRAIQDAQRTGVGFAGFATWLDMTPAHPDMRAVPEPHPLIQLPWQPEVGWLTSRLWMDGCEVETAPRTSLRHLVIQAEKAGYRLISDIDCGFLLTQADGGSACETPHPQHPRQGLRARTDQVLAEIRTYVNALGWGPCRMYRDADGACRGAWSSADALRTADRHVFFRFMVDAVAERHGLRAAFTPSPQLTGNPCHTRTALWDWAGRHNLFLHKRDRMGLSTSAYRFLGGVVHHMQALGALCNPSAHSSLHLQPPPTSSGIPKPAEGRPHDVGKRTHRIHVPWAGCLEFRLMNGAAHPYLLQAGIWAAGLAGVRRRYPRTQVRIRRKLHRPLRPPASLPDALHLLQRNRTLRTALGGGLIDALVRLKLQE